MKKRMMGLLLSTVMISSLLTGTIGTTRKKIVALTTNLYPVDGVEYESFNESEDEEEVEDE